MLKRESISQELLQESQKLNDELQAKLNAVLKDLQNERGYDFILSYGAGTGVLMVNDALVLINGFNTLIRDGKPFKEALYEAALSRFRPIKCLLLLNMTI